jgi:hypothetical protein
MSLTIRILLILVSLINVVLVRGNLQVISGDVSSSNSHFADSEESSRQRILNNIFPTTIDEQELVYSYNGVRKYTNILLVTYSSCKFCR